MLTNLLGVGPQVALQFATVETLKKWIKRTYEPNQDRLSLHFIALCGWAAGLGSALIVVAILIFCRHPLIMPAFGLHSLKHK